MHALLPQNNIDFHVWYGAETYTVNETINNVTILAF